MKPIQNNVYMNGKLWPDTTIFFGSGVGIGFPKKEDADEFYEEYLKSKDKRLYHEVVSNEVETYYSCVISNPNSGYYTRKDYKMLNGCVFNFDASDSGRYIKGNTIFKSIEIKNEVIKIKRNLGLGNLLDK